MDMVQYLFWPLWFDPELFRVFKRPPFRSPIAFPERRNQSVRMPAVFTTKQQEGVNQHLNLEIFLRGSMSTLGALKRPPLSFKLVSQTAGHMNPAAAKLLAFVLKIHNLVQNILADQKLKQSKLPKRGVGRGGVAFLKRIRQPSVLLSPTRNASLTETLCARWGGKKSAQPSGAPTCSQNFENRKKKGLNGECDWFF